MSETVQQITDAVTAWQVEDEKFVAGNIAGGLNTAAAGIPLRQKTTVVGVTMYYSGAVSTTSGLILRLYNTTAPTSGGGTTFATINYPATSNTIYRFLNVSNTIDPGAASPQYLQVTLSTNNTGYSGGGTLVVNIGTY